MKNMRGECPVVPELDWFGTRGVGARGLFSPPDSAAMVYDSGVPASKNLFGI